MDSVMAEGSSSTMALERLAPRPPPLGRHKTAEYLAVQDRYAHVDRVLDRRGPWTDEAFVGGQEASQSTMAICCAGTGC